MASITGDDKLLDNQDQQLQGQSNGSQNVSSGSSNDVGNGAVSTAGVGAGGTGGWTNIQSYLNANQGDTGSAQALNKTVGDQFNKEKDAYTQDSSKFLNDANKQVADQKIDNNQADQLIKSNSTDYSYGGGDQSTAYKGNVQKVQGALNNAYSGPTSYSYGFTAPTQNYGSAVKDGGGFDTLMNQLYSNAAGKNLSNGQYQLQKQLDVNNSALTDARSNLANQYDQLGANRDKAVADTTAGLGQAEQTYRTNQNALRDYLTGQSNNYETSEGQAEANAKKSYNDAMRADFHGNGSIDTLTNRIRNAGNYGGAGGGWYWGGDNYNGAFGQGQHDYVNSPLASGGIDLNPSGQLGSELSNWQYNQLQANQNVGDPEKRSFNAIQDFLNSDAARKQAGFNVRGW